MFVAKTAAKVLWIFAAVFHEIKDFGVVFINLENNL